MSTLQFTTTTETPVGRFTEDTHTSKLSSLDEQPSNCLQSILTARAASFPSRCMYFYPLGSTGSTPHPISYSFLYDKATRISRKLASLSKFRDGSPVLIHLDGHWDTILLFWAVLLANGIPVLSTPLSNIEDHRNQHLRHLSHLLESPICITEAESLHLFADSGHAFELYTIESLRSVEINYPSLPISDPIWPSWRAVNGEAYNSKQRLASPTILMLTSGSTGNAKLVPLTHKQIIAAVSGKASVRQLPAGGSFFNWVGLDHVASLVEIHIQALWMGVDQVHAQAADVVSSPRLFLDLLSRHGVCRSFAPNFFLAKLVAAAADDDVTRHAWDLSKLTVLASGGEPNEVATCVAASALLARYGARRDCITPGFGMTETCAGAIFNLECPDHDTSEGLTIASLGRCMPGIEMRVTSSAAGKENVPGTLGHLELRGDVVFGGYYRNPAATAEAFTSDGWFRTGDLAVIDDDGNLNLTGRTKDVININGVKITTADIQASLEVALRDTCASRVVSFPSRARGASTEQITVAYIPRQWPPTTEDMAEVDSRAVQACMMVSTACVPFIFPVGEQSLPFLPVTTLGKVSGAKMRVLFESGVFDQDAAYHRKAVSEFKQLQQHMSAVSALTEAEGRLRRDLAETMGVKSPDVVDVNTSVFELGLTSMDLIRLKHRIDARLGFAMATSVILRHPTVRSLAAALTKFERDYALLRASDTTTEPASVDNQPVAAEAEYDPVVTLRSSGSKAPLWLVHPGVGEVFVFVGLAQHMQVDDRPMYAFRARGFEPGQETFGSINEAVATYVSEIRRRQPQGPYALAGYSYGTMLAFEMAKCLESGGEKVGFLGSFNLPPHIKTRMRQLGWNMCILHLAQFLGLIPESRVEDVLAGDSAYLDASTADALAHVLDIADTTRMSELGLGSRELARWTDVAHGLQSMAVDYEPSGNVAVIDVFHAEPLKVAASSREEWVTDQLGKWRDFCRTEPRFHEVGGAHYTMIDQDHVHNFSKTLREALHARGI
ncbi:thioesterase domain [Fusarium albosuccineum]|uniref:Thioesterase domain n=1 Tax=Fusarium albosuccineum TaxID=1237068 RepID=A0A8H4KGY9_9HYPO|nr:thioesterase domain [Fusarium albosuccineum]